MVGGRVEDVAFLMAERHLHYFGYGSKKMTANFQTTDTAFKLVTSQMQHFAMAASFSILDNTNRKSVEPEQKGNALLTFQGLLRSRPLHMKH